MILFILLSMFWILLQYIIVKDNIIIVNASDRKPPKSKPQHNLHNPRLRVLAHPIPETYAT